MSKKSGKSKKDREGKPRKEKKEKSKKRKEREEPVPQTKKQKTESNTTPTLDVESFREENMITVDMGAVGSDVAPLCSFDQCKETFPETETYLDAYCKGFEKPSPIQAQCWPIGLGGRDLIGVAETGSGKTLGFLIPGIVKLLNGPTKAKPQKKKPGILVISPTRELAMQSDNVCNAVKDETGISSVLVAGGMDRRTQNQGLKNGAQVVFATPGRLKSLLEENDCDLSQCSYVVLDEADRMLDMGFEPDIRTIMSYLPKKRQTVMFSATWPQEIRQLASKYLNQPVRVTIGSDDLSANKRVTQIVEVIDAYQKDRKLGSLLEKYHHENNRILIFCLYKKEAARVERNLYNKGWNVKGIHGDMGQQQRTEAFNSFRDGSVPLLVATDVASRGLDIPNVEYVINYTFPLTIEDYIHRIGRTGRANKTGIAHTLFTVNEKTKAGDLCTILKEANQKVPKELEKFGPSIKKKKEHGMYGAYYKEGANDIPSKPKKITFDSDSE